MKTLEQIKNDYAIDLGYDDWESLMIEVCYFSNEEFFEHENEVMILVQKECLKLASENAWNGYVVTGMQEVADDVKKSITNENNIIK